MTFYDKYEPITAIVVDDDVDTLDLFCEFLEIHQFKIVGKAYNGEKVAELYLKFKPDVVFLDVMMDNYDGIYALEQIRKKSPDAIVIMVTADVSSKTAEKLELLHATAVLYKPFDIKNVIDMVRKLVIAQRNNTDRLEQPELLVPPVEPAFVTHTQKISEDEK